MELDNSVKRHDNNETEKACTIQKDDLTLERSCLVIVKGLFACLLISKHLLYHSTDKDFVFFPFA